MNRASTAGGVLPFVEARRLVEQEAYLLQAAVISLGPAGRETKALLEAQNRVLAEEVRADRDLPPFRRATRDGYAVRSADVSQVPARLKVVAEIRAGQPFIGEATSIAAGEAAQIMTGAPAPPGSDAVVMVEFTALHGAVVEVLRPVRAGENIVPQGSEASQGALLLSPGACLDYAHLSLAAAAGKTHLEVYRRPRVAILATGDEVVEIEKQPGPSEIRNSNSYSLAAQIQSAGGIPWRLDIAPDELTRLKALIEQGLRADLLLLSGGVSMGKYDLVQQALEAFHAEFAFTGAEIQPGRPVVFGRARPAAGERPTCFLGLPGNPVSTMVTFELFARPLIQGLQGRPPTPLTPTSATLSKGFAVAPGLTRFLPAVLEGSYPDSQVTMVPWRGSGDVVALAQGNCFVVVAPDRAGLQTGEMVPLLLRHP